MVPVHCISISQMLKIDFRNENFKIFMFETTRPTALIFGMVHHLADLHHVCSYYAPGSKNDLPCGPDVSHWLIYV